MAQKQSQTNNSSNQQSLRPAHIVSGLGVIVVVGLVFFWLGSDRPKASLDGASSSGGSASISIEPKEIDMGTVPMSKGIVEKAFAIKNNGTGTLRITGLQTSCMCTSAQLEVQGEKSEIFGMAGMGGGHHGGSGAASKSWSMEILPGGEGTLHSLYDPNAHGPAGVGPIERSIMFTTNDSAHQNVEVRIRGVVTSD